jgi:hypothetical protein
MFSSSHEGWETPTLLGPLERANLNHWLSLSNGLDRVGVSQPSSEDGNRCSFRNVVFLCCLERQTMYNVQKPSNLDCYPVVAENGRLVLCFSYLRIQLILSVL